MSLKKTAIFLVWGSDNGTLTAGDSNTTTIATGLTTDNSNKQEMENC
jgi:hypothetical protein